ncbi:hypothetical protein PCYB_131930, partial [Plasmodium cynomolgi strain B]
IIHSGVLKGHRNVYFYKCLLRIAEKRKNDLSLHQINIILKALLRGKIYRYVSFHSFERPILNHLNWLSGLISHLEEGTISGRRKTQQSRNGPLRITHDDHTNGKEAHKCKQFLLRDTILHTLGKPYLRGGDPSKVEEVISDQFDIIVDIFKSYLKILNFHFCFLSQTIFFFIVRNCQYLPHGQNLLSIWGMYVKRVLSSHRVVSLSPKEGCPPQMGRHQQIGGDSTAYLFPPPVHEPPGEEPLMVKLYRYKYTHQNVHAKTVRNYTVAFKNEKRKKGEGKKKHPCNPLFCKNGNLTLCKYMVMLILKQDKLASYCKLIKKKRTNYKNAYLSNGYLYKMKNTNMVLDFQSTKYLIKVGFVQNRAFLRGEGFPKDLLTNGPFLRSVSNWMSKLNVRCRLLSGGINRDSGALQ